MTSEKVEIIAPLKVPQNSLYNFIQSKQDWVVAAIAKVKVAQDTVNKAPSHYCDGILIPYKGKKYKVQVNSQLIKKINITFDGERFVVCLPDQITEQNKSDCIRRGLVDWMKQQALKQVSIIVELYAKKQGLYPRFIRVKTQKSRWGSCGIHNDIHLNWLLILAPPEVLEYVVVHELCHIKERNHSIRFWQLVEDHLPSYQHSRNWLKKNGHNLMQGL